MGPLHYRRSLASRVTLLAGMAVGLSVAIVALAGYATVRMQMYSSLDQSLLERAAAATIAEVDARTAALADKGPVAEIPEALSAEAVLKPLLGECFARRQQQGDSEGREHGEAHSKSGRRAIHCR